MNHFDVLVADPPWKFGDGLGKRGAQANYSVMTTEAICAMEIPLMQENAWAFIWAVSALLEDSLKVAAAWNFKVKSQLIWRKLTVNSKPHFGMGHYTRAAHETCLVCTRGKVKPAARSIRSVFDAPMPRGENGRVIHSAKPDRFFELVEELTGPGLRRVEMFGRRQRKGWTVIGNEANKFKAAP